jgi:hypothetical protein
MESNRTVSRLLVWSIARCMSKTHNWHMESGDAAWPALEKGADSLQAASAHWLKFAVVSTLSPWTLAKYRPEELGITWPIVETIVMQLPEYAKRVPWHTIVTEFGTRGTEGKRDLAARFAAAMDFVQRLH